MPLLEVMITESRLWLAACKSQISRFADEITSVKSRTAAGKVFSLLFFFFFSLVWQGGRLRLAHVIQLGYLSCQTNESWKWGGQQNKESEWRRWRKRSQQEEQQAAGGRNRQMVTDEKQGALLTPETGNTCLHLNLVHLYLSIWPDRVTDRRCHEGQRRSEWRRFGSRSSWRRRKMLKRLTASWSKGASSRNRWPSLWLTFARSWNLLPLPTSKSGSRTWWKTLSQSHLHSLSATSSCSPWRIRQSIWSCAACHVVRPSRSRSGSLRVRGRSGQIWRSPSCSRDSFGVSLSSSWTACPASPWSWSWHPACGVTCFPHLTSTRWTWTTSGDVSSWITTRKRTAFTCVTMRSAWSQSDCQRAPGRSSTPKRFPIWASSGTWTSSWIGITQLLLPNQRERLMRWKTSVRLHSASRYGHGGTLSTKRVQ